MYISVGFTWIGQCVSLTGCWPSRFLGVGDNKVDKTRQPENPCQPSEISQNLFAHYTSIYTAFRHFLLTIMTEEPKVEMPLIPKKQ